MLDLECEGADGLVVELFNVLFGTIWYELKATPTLRICVICFVCLALHCTPPPDRPVAHSGPGFFFFSVV